MSAILKDNKKPKPLIKDNHRPLNENYNRTNNFKQDSDNGEKNGNNTRTGH